MVENKIPNINTLVKKTDYNTKITEIEKKHTDHNNDKYITTPEFNTLAADIFNARLAQAIKLILIIVHQVLIVKLQQIKQKMRVYLK